MAQPTMKSAELLSPGTQTPIPRRRVVQIAVLVSLWVCVFSRFGSSIAQAQPNTSPANNSNTALKSSGRTEKSILVDRVVAVINDEVILSSELMMRVAPMAYELKKISNLQERMRRQSKLAAQVLGEMINESLVTQAAATAKLEVGTKEVDAAIKDLKKQNKLNDAQLKEALRMQGYSISSYRKDVRNQIARMRAVNTLVRPRVSISDEDVRARYDAKARRATSVSQVHLQHIMLMLPSGASEQERSTKRDLAAQIIARATSGEDFGKLAQMFSADASTKNTGGDLGWIERGAIALEWEAIVFAMAPGDTRGPVNGPRGLHVFHVSEIKKSKQENYASVKDKLKNELYRAELDKQTRLWVDDLRKKAHFEIKL